MNCSERVDKFRIWTAKADSKLMVPCRNRYGDTAHFRSYPDGVVMIGFGEGSGLEPDKDAFVIDKHDVPAVIEFLQASIAE